MNETTLLTNLKSRLVAQAWTGSSNVVFATGSVAITFNVEQAMKGAWASGMRAPYALLQPLDSASDPEFDEDPNFVTMRVNVRLVAVVPGDAVGENVLQGANKTGGATKSEGRGLFELEVELHNAIGKVNALESVILQCRQKSAVAGTTIENGTHAAWRDYVFEAIGTMV